MKGFLEMMEMMEIMSFINDVCPEVLEKDTETIKSEALKNKKNTTITINQAEFAEKSAEAVADVVVRMLKRDDKDIARMAKHVTFLSPIIISEIEKAIFTTKKEEK